MSDKRFWLLAAAATALIVVSGAVAAAQSTSRIICWKDESGRVVGCGDRVPPEYRGSATKELDNRGITRKTTETPEEAAKRRAEEQERAKQEEEQRRQLAEERRQNRALLATYANEQEIDDRRDRELEQVEARIRQLDVSLKNVSERRVDLEKRRAVAVNDKYLRDGLPEINSELDKVSAELQRLVERIAGQEKLKTNIRAQYEEQKQRFRTLKGAPVSANPSRPN
jgi:chromosome segregation ATPase